MKQLICFFIACFAATDGFASGVVIQAAGASPESYLAFLKEHPSMRSHSQYQSEKQKENPRQEEDLFRIAENLETDPGFLIAKLQTINNSGALSPTSLNFLFDLTTKLLERSDFKNNSQIKTMNCKVRGLLEIPMEKCRKVQVDFQSISRQWPFASVLMVESSAFLLGAVNHLEISEEAIYQFTLLSDTHKNVVFKGTYTQFMQQQFAAELLVEGECRRFASNIEDFQIINSGSAFFNKDCIQPINNPKTSSSFGEWVQGNKAWVYPAGLLLIGGAIAYGMKDKTLVITKP
ncbi:hypothetical protein ACLVWU_15995 [Bdellovibrio sp. HCB290]|uniref:hypothetical protein n=1 Tax=Bdellovibrio sp. HCB290 TaxID=3394356 RepID=UPI0039B4D7CC